MIKLKFEAYPDPWRSVPQCYLAPLYAITAENISKSSKSNSIKILLTKILDIQTNLFDEVLFLKKLQMTNIDTYLFSIYMIRFVIDWHVRNFFHCRKGYIIRTYIQVEANY